MNREEIINHLSKRLSMGQLAELLLEVFDQRDNAPRALQRARRSGHAEIAKPLLAMVYRSIEAGEDGEEIDQDLTLVGRPDPEKYHDAPKDPDPGLWEFGECERCQLDIVCSRKHAICPLCDAKVYCT